MIKLHEYLAWEAGVLRLASAGSQLVACTLHGAILTNGGDGDGDTTVPCSALCGPGQPTHQAVEALELALQSPEGMHKLLNVTALRL